MTFNSRVTLLLRIQVFPSMVANKDNLLDLCKVVFVYIVINFRRPSLFLQRIFIKSYYYTAVFLVQFASEPLQILPP